ncbi:MAG: hypothetical protein IIZ39_07235 [Blautia sp.]|nr:hypothetical protein [Blautia sp.]
MKESMQRWLDGDIELFDAFPEAAEEPDDPREALKERKKTINKVIDREAGTQRFEHIWARGFSFFYNIVAVSCCVILIGVLLYTVAHLPYFGQENPRTVEVVERYTEKGLEETGAVNVVAGMILDYRAFDTLGESHVLFAALICVTVLLRRDKKNMRKSEDDYFTLTGDAYYGIHKDSILHTVGYFLIPCIFLYAFYILLNGQNSPGGGFSGGAILGAGMILFAASFGFEAADKIFTQKLCSLVTLIALGFYSFAKGYVFFTGANGMENGIPKGIPGAILSGGLILPLDIAVGCVVACTMYGFYNLYRRGTLGKKKKKPSNGKKEG